MSSEEIDDLIDQWHAMPNPPCELHEWLGMSWEDYKECFSDDSMPSSGTGDGASAADTLHALSAASSV